MEQMVGLKVLNVENCFKLNESTPPQMNFASLPDFVVHASSDKCSSNIILLQPTNPDKLTIQRLERVKSTEEASNVKLIQKQKIEELTFQWTVAAERFVDDKEVLEKLVPPSSVRTLSINGYGSVSIPDWLMGMRQYLPNLSQLDLGDFSKCNNLPPLGQLPNLRRLRISHMEMLEEWNTTSTGSEEGANERMFPKLEMLRIEECAKLRIKPCLPTAMCMDVSDCDTMLSSWAETSPHSGASSSSPITELNLAKSKVPMHQWRLLHHLPAIRKLTITRCSDLTASPEIIQRLSSVKTLCLNQEELPRWLVELTSLQELHLFVCRGMKSLPEWLGDLSFLKKIDIKCCYGIMSLPDSIQQLTKLEYLTIIGCDRLMKWCESKENRMKLAHIKCKVFPTSEEEDIAESVEETTNSLLDTASGSRIDNKRERPSDD